MSRKKKKGSTTSDGKSWRDWPHKGKAFKVLIVLAVIAVGAAALAAMRSSVLGSPSYAGKLARVRLAQTPKNLPPDVPVRVVADLQARVDGRSVFDSGLVREVYAAAVAHPWIAKVHQVRKLHDGSVVVRADFRHPFALVAVEDYPGEFHVVDVDGVVMPLGLDRIRPGAFIKIDGVATDPPEPGRKWDAPDLDDGLRLARLLKGRPYESQITAIDVRNHNGRISPIDPQLCFYAQVGRTRRTRVFFGRFPTPDGLDYCLAPEVKLSNLDVYVEDNRGKLAGLKEWIDLRHEQLYVSLD